jgi:eukaryotic-like serine/threonine-protein kinase
MKPLDSRQDPSRLGPFALLARLGEGGMGRAYLARWRPSAQLTPERLDTYRLSAADDVEAGDQGLVVVKVIRPDLLDGGEALPPVETVRARFASEIDAVRAVVSRRVPALLAADAVADRPWLAMDYVHGPTLRKLVVSVGCLPPVPYAALGVALVEALRAIHGAGLYHRDLKPGNVMLGSAGPVVLDFGLAVLAERRSSQALTQSRARLGTDCYMPLEQLRDAKNVDHAADVYALGATLYFAACGRPPFPYFPLDEEPSWTGVAEPFRPLLQKIIIARPELRPSLDEVEKDLLDLLAAHDATLEQAFRQLAETSGAPGMAPDLPDEPPADHPGPGNEPPDIPWAGPETDLFEEFFGTGSGDAAGATETAGDTPGPAEAPTAPLPDPAPTLPLPPPTDEPSPEPDAVPHSPLPPPRGATRAASPVALRVADDLCAAYALSSTL